MYTLRTGSGSLVLLLFVTFPAFAQLSFDFQVIINPENPASRASRDEISEMFLKKTRRWSDGKEVLPINLESQAGARASFSETIHGRSVANIESYWQQQIFSGRAKPPLVVAGDEQMMAEVSRSPGAIGYVSATAQLSGVKKLSVETLPERLEYISPRYSATARRARVVGEVVLEVSIDENGLVTDAVPVKELGFGLTREAINAVKRWKYRPATLDGRPVPTVISVSVKFDPSTG